MALKLAPQKSCRVLIWLANQDPNSTDPAFVSTYQPVADVYAELNVCTDIVLDPDTDFWTGNIFDYRLVFIDTASTDPSWWADLNYTGTPPDWRGRIVLVSENSGISIDDHHDWINGLTATTGLTVVPTEDSGNGSVETDDLTTGCTAPLSFGLSSHVSGGTTLSISTTDDTSPLLTHNEVETIDWVLSGDSNVFFDYTADADNERLLQNLWTVALP